MIRDLFTRRAEVRDLRDRAVQDAATIARLRDETARLTGQLATHDQHLDGAIVAARLGVEITTRREESK